MPDPTTARRFKLAPGLQEVLKVLFASTLVEDHRKVWQAEIEAGEIGEETLAVLDAMHLISSRQDARITKVAEPPAAITSSRRFKSVDGGAPESSNAPSS